MTMQTAPTPAELELRDTRARLAEAEAVYRHPRAHIAAMQNEILVLEGKARRERGEALAIAIDPDWPAKVRAAELALRAAEREERAVKYVEIRAADMVGFVPGEAQPVLVDEQGGLDKQIAIRATLRARIALRRLRQWPAELLAQAEVQLVNRRLREDLADAPLAIERPRLRDRVAGAVDSVLDTAMRATPPPAAAAPARSARKR